MSLDQLKVVHFPNRRCKFSESVDLKIHNKTVITPTFAPRIKNDGELALYLDIKNNYRPNYLSAYVVRLLDVGRTLYPTLKKSALPSLLSETIDIQLSPSFGDDILFVDPALEYLYYSTNMARLAEAPFVSRTVKTYVKRFMEKSKQEMDDPEKWQGLEAFRDREHTNFWTCVYKEAGMRMKLIRDTFNVELKCRADMLVPPVPLITSRHLLDVAISMNEKSRAFASGKRECADYFILKQQVLKNEHIMSTIKEYVADSESPLTIFKFKSLNLNQEDLSLERSAFKSFLMELSLVSQHSENKAFALFESGNQTFPAALCSFAIMSTSFSIDREDRRPKKEVSPFGNWYDPESMLPKNQETFSAMVNNAGGVIPCNCDICKTNPDLLKDVFIEYNHKVKKHYMLCREQEMKEVVTAIGQQDTQMGFEKLQRSSLKNLIDIIPR